jgi:nitrite reductase/ring-hydroxylating ferredoxin subunit
MRRARYAVAKASEIPPDTGTIVRIGDCGECALFCHDGRWHAVGSLCPHQNTPLEGARAEDGALTCSRHGYRFDLSTGECLTVGGYGVPVFPVEVEGDTIFVSVWEYD